MTTPLNFPKSGMGISEGTVVRWLKAIGDHVKEGEIVVEIETAKAIQEIAAPTTGILTNIFAAPGEEASVNSILATIEEVSA